MKNFHQSPNIFVGQVNINVTNLNSSLEFYQKVIGFQILEQTDRKAVLTADGKIGLLTIEQPVDVLPKEKGKTGLFHFALLLPTRADLSVFLRHLSETGFRFAASDHLVSEALYITDPDGNGIEVYIDRPAIEWTWSNGEVKMVSDPLDVESLLAVSDMDWDGLPADTVMGHVHMHVADLQKAEEFYTKGLGFTVVSHYPQAVFISTGDYHHHIALNTWQGVGASKPRENSVGINWYTLTFPNEEAIAKVIEQLQYLGASYVVEDGLFVIEDPSGNKIQLTV
ncbi:MULTISPECIES: VOC family protein [Sporosarcina]|uniref:VOC family protein n=1 Tax=Sporosarcina TaxID=1569 RepID=UPI000A17B8A5|nr:MULTISPECIES: VOC family protein [Sporosarcina]ARK22830.1 glyoxalase [Sporosarcina ureae]PIC75322.1 glyoxalase [Sporosarcina sp. P17b]